VVAGMATMPSRAATFPLALNSIIQQVDRLYLYLDGHSEIPDLVKNDSRVVPILSSEAPGFASDGKFLGLGREFQPCLYLGVDDDIEYPPDYVVTLHNALRAANGPAVVGYHGSILNRAVKSYRSDRTVLFFGHEMSQPRAVDVLGTGTVMFDTAHLNFDVRTWSCVNKNDLFFAIEATKAGVPLICLPRDANYLRPLATAQSDSLYVILTKDDSQETLLANELLEIQRNQSVPQEP
jgi:hypothetical protein